MRLYLVQHGESKSEDVDPARGLTDKGLADVRKVAAFLRPSKISVAAVWHSGKTRAAQTAEALVPVMNVVRGVVRHDGLAPKDPVEVVAESVTPLSEDLMLVGHLPFLSKLASLLVAGSESADVAAFKMGGVVCLERDPSGVWRIRWMVTPELLD